MPLSTIHPAGVLLGIALLVALTRGVLQKLILLLGTAMAVWVVLRLAPGTHWTVAFPLGTLHVLQVDALSMVFALIFSLITSLSVLYALHRPCHGRARGDAALRQRRAGGGLCR